MLSLFDPTLEPDPEPPGDLLKLIPMYHSPKILSAVLPGQLQLPHIIQTANYGRNINIGPAIFSHMARDASVALLVARWTTDHYHLSSNLSIGISEGRFIFDSLSCSPLLSLSLSLSIYIYIYIYIYINAHNKR